MTESREWPPKLARAIDRRRTLLSGRETDVCRVLHGEADGFPGVFVDRFGPGATLIRHEGAAAIDEHDAQRFAAMTLGLLAPFGVEAIYDKPYTRDRSAGAGDRSAVLTDPRPIAGQPLAEAVIVHEHGRVFEARLYDGFSVGIFLDQRLNRTFLALGSAGRRVLNTFAYTGGFSVACALAGATTTSVDVSGRYLDWTKRNFAENQLDAAAHHFARIDTREFMELCRRKGRRFDLIIIDPPTFASANKRRGVAAWSVERDLGPLVAMATEVLDPGGSVFVSTNASSLSEAGGLRRVIVDALRSTPRWLETPAAPEDFPGERDRAVWAMFAPR